MSLPHESMPERLRTAAANESRSVQELSGIPMILPTHQMVGFEWLFADFTCMPPIRAVQMGVNDTVPAWARQTAQEYLDHMLERYNWWQWACNALGREAEAFEALIEPPEEVAQAKSSEYPQVELEAFRFGGGFDKKHFDRFRQIAKKVIDTANLFDGNFYQVNLCILPSDESVRLALIRQGRAVLLLDDETFMNEPEMNLASFVRVNALGPGYHNANRDTDPFVSHEEYARVWGLREPISTTASFI